MLRFWWFYCQGTPSTFLAEFTRACLFFEAVDLLYRDFPETLSGVWLADTESQKPDWFIENTLILLPGKTMSNDVLDLYLPNINNCIESAKYQITRGNHALAIEFLNQAKKTLAKVKSEASQ